jgi:hypothetical protein
VAAHGGHDAQSLTKIEIWSEHEERGVHAGELDQNDALFLTAQG